MQSESEDKTKKWGMPEEFDAVKIMEELKNNPVIKKFHVFKSYHKNGKPTKEMRRAWRRYNVQKI